MFSMSAFCCAGLSSAYERMTLYPAFSSLFLRLRPSLFQRSADFVGIEIPIVAPFSNDCVDCAPPRALEQAPNPTSMEAAAIKATAFLSIDIFLPKVIINFMKLTYLRYVRNHNILIVVSWSE